MSDISKIKVGDTDYEIKDKVARESIETLENNLGTTIESTIKPQIEVLSQDMQDLKKSVSDGKSSLASAITNKGVATSSDDTFSTMTNNINSIQLGVGNASASDVLSGKTYSSDEGTDLTGTMPNNGAWKGSTSGSGNVGIPAGYHNGNGYVSGSGAYNAGVTYADGRANTSSTNYKTGYNAGVNATKKGNASTGDVLKGKTFTNSSSVNATGSMVDNSGAPLNAKAVSSDANYTYFTIPTAGYYDTFSQIKASNSSIGEPYWIFKSGTGALLTFNWTKGDQKNSSFKQTDEKLICRRLAAGSCSVDIRTNTVTIQPIYSKLLVDFEMTVWESDYWGPYFYVNGKSVYKLPITKRKIVLIDIPANLTSFNFWSVGCGNIDIYNIALINSATPIMSLPSLLW